MELQRASPLSRGILTVSGHTVQFRRLKLDQLFSWPKSMAGPGDSDIPIDTISTCDIANRLGVHGPPHLTLVLRVDSIGEVVLSVRT